MIANQETLLSIELLEVGHLADDGEPCARLRITVVPERQERWVQNVVLERGKLHGVMGVIIDADYMTTAVREAEVEAASAITKARRAT